MNTDSTKHPDDNKNKTTFRRVLICPIQSQLSFISGRQFIAIDGTFLKGFYSQTLLLAVTVDANGQYRLLTWAMVERNTKNMWKYCFRHFSYSVPQILNATIIIDQDKGLLSAEEMLGSNVAHLLCLHHLKCNFIQRWGQIHLSSFCGIANSTTNAKN